MPWKESSVMDERLRFVARLLEGEPMSHVCREFGISRKTGYKIFDRYKDHGLEGLTDRSRRPVHYAPSARGCHHVLGTFCYPCLRVGQGGSGGWGGIRTHERLAPLPVFKTGALNRSATHPARADNHRAPITWQACLRACHTVNERRNWHPIGTRHRNRVPNLAHVTDWRTRSTAESEAAVRPKR
jgi:Helix-turn-helix domain